jgi:dolichol-phosphate mannosyltransferase
MSLTPRISVAIPVYNEAAGLPELLRRLRGVLDELAGGPHEILFVDDGSSDGTLAALERAAVEDQRLAVVSLSRNFGHQAALAAALDHVTGEVVVLMDGDLQDPPEAIPQFLDKFREGYDVVYAIRASRKEPIWLRGSYFLFYRLMAWLSKVHVPLDAGDFGLMSRRAVEELRRVSERNRYLRGLRAWVGFRQIGIPVDREARHAGASKYSRGKLLALAFDGIFAFSVVPLRAATLIGAGALAMSSAYALYALYAKLALDQSPRGFTATIVIVTFFSGVILFFLGIIGEYVGRVYEEVKARPIYIVAKVIGRD